MLAIDIPISVLTGMVIADAGRELLRDGDPEKRATMRNTVLLYCAFFLTPIPVYFFLGWPAWETNYLWEWPDSLTDNPARAATVAFGAFVLTMGPAYLGLRLAGALIRRGHDKWVRVCCAALLLAVGVILLLTRDITFNISSTQAKFAAHDSYPFLTNPFFAGWLIVTVYFWGSLAVCYAWIRRSSSTLRVGLAVGPQPRAALHQPSP